MLDAIIIGTGFSGICAAIKLKEAGFGNLVILEKADSIGGTWRDNTYPGAECDVPSTLYSFSFEKNPDWNYRWAEQPQILSYIETVAKKHALHPLIRFGQHVVRAAWDEAGQCWAVDCESGERFVARHLISGVGQLHHPHWPAIDGLRDFAGKCFHSARWDHSVDLAGKNVAVIGTGASAIQFIPPVAKQAKTLHIFQRGPNWIMPKMDKPYTDFQKRLRTMIPALSSLDRLRTWLRAECLFMPIMRGNRLFQAIIRWLCTRRIRRHIKDPDLAAKLTPDYPPGAKRILFADDYYETLAMDHVHLHTSPIQRVAERSILMEDESVDDLDVIILGTGFITNPFLSDIEVIGRDGVELHSHWQGGARAYLGITCTGFPNFFMLYGPNTNLGHNSIIHMIESQVRFIVDSLQKLQREEKHSIEVRPEAEQAYNTQLQSRLQNMVWAKTESWYTQDGRITNNWAGSTQEYRRRTRKVRDEDFWMA